MSFDFPTEMFEGVLEEGPQLGSGLHGTMYGARVLCPGAERFSNMCSQDDPEFIALKVQKDTGQGELEFNVMEKLDHNNIAKAYWSARGTQLVKDTDTSMFYAAMELLPGGSLHRYELNETALPLLVARWTLEVLAGQHEMHRLGFVHRDLKPANVVLDHPAANAAHAKIIDFGVSCCFKRMILDKPECDSVAPRCGGLYGNRVGTPAYMGPNHGTPQGDLWSTGILVYKLATHEYPIWTGGHPGQGDPRLDKLRSFTTTRSFQSLVKYLLGDSSVTGERTAAAAMALAEAWLEEETRASTASSSWTP